MDKQLLIEKLEGATKEWIEAVLGMSDKTFNQRPAEERWSAREIIEHINIIDISTYRMIKSSESTPTDRDPQGKCPQIEKVFLNFDKKFTARGPIIPPTEPKPKSEVLEKFEGVRKKLIHHTREQDLRLTCPEFSHPLFGTMTRFEWVYFVNVHAQRHFRQLQQAITTLNDQS